MNRFIILLTILLLSLTLIPTAAAENSANNRSVETLEDDPFENDDSEMSSIQNMEVISDPLEGYNRIINAFNDKLYFYFLKPVATGYDFIVPKPARVCVKRVFHNAAMPGRFINCLLQGKLTGAGRELSRFAINTTFGLGGLFSPAESCIKQYNEDSDQTLGYYGIGTGIYIVWPILGPSSLRGTIGKIIDTGLDPLNYTKIKVYERLSIKTYDTLNKTSLKLGEYEQLKKSAIDPYISLRNAYFQHRQNAVKK